MSHVQIVAILQFESCQQNISLLHSRHNCMQGRVGVAPSLPNLKLACRIRVHVLSVAVVVVPCMRLLC
jgi:hypothetical protein